MRRQDPSELLPGNSAHCHSGRTTTISDACLARRAISKPGSLPGFKGPTVTFKNAARFPRSLRTTAACFSVKDSTPSTPLLETLT